jgi:hypothetical protein
MSTKRAKRGRPRRPLLLTPAQLRQVVTLLGGQRAAARATGRRRFAVQLWLTGAARPSPADVAVLLRHVVSGARKLFAYQWPEKWWQGIESAAELERSILVDDVPTESELEYRQSVTALLARALQIEPRRIALRFDARVRGGAVVLRNFEVRIDGKALDAKRTAALAEWCAAVTRADKEAA